MSKKVLIGIPPELLIQVDFVAQSEQRTRSDLIREALRRYVATFRLSEVAVCVQQNKELVVESLEESRRVILDESYACSSRLAG